MQSECLQLSGRGVDEALIAQSFEEQLKTLLSQLDDKERLIIERRFGLGDREPQTLAEIGRLLGEHESSVSRNLERIRRDLRGNVEAVLRKDSAPVNGAPSQPGLSDAQIALCFQYASEDAPIDLDKLLPRTAPPKPARPAS